MCCAADNHNYICHICAKAFLYLNAIASSATDRFICKNLKSPALHLNNDNFCHWNQFWIKFWNFVQCPVLSTFVKSSQIWKKKINKQIK